MRGNRKSKGRFTQHGHGLGTVTEEMVRQRAAELALINGRRPGQVLDSDLDEARRELTGAAGLVPAETAAEQLTEDQREAVPASRERPAAKVLPTDEQTLAEKLVE